MRRDDARLGGFTSGQDRNGGDFRSRTGGGRDQYGRQAFAFQQTDAVNIRKLLGAINREGSDHLGSIKRTAAAQPDNDIGTSDFGRFDGLQDNRFRRVGNHGVEYRDLETGSPQGLLNRSDQARIDNALVGDDHRSGCPQGGDLAGKLGEATCAKVEHGDGLEYKVFHGSSLLHLWFCHAIKRGRKFRPLLAW